MSETAQTASVKLKDGPLDGEFRRIARQPDNQWPGQLIAEDDVGAKHIYESQGGGLYYVFGWTLSEDGRL